MNWFRGVLQVIAYIIACVGILMVASTMRSSMNERKRDFAILRSLGASRWLVTGVILGHALIISLLGALGSLLIMQGISLVTQQIIVEETGVLLGGMSLQLVDLFVFGGVVVTGLLGELASAMVLIFRILRVTFSRPLKLSYLVETGLIILIINL